MSESESIGWISGFWRRIGSFFIDSIFLGVVGLGLGLVFEGVFVEIGVWGRLIGFSIALIYFGTMNSTVFNGQTIGKRLLKIRVVNKNNNTVGLARSFFRYSIIGVPFFLNNAQLPAEILSSFWLYGLSFIIFGGLFSLVYLYVFNRATRQSLHDLLFGTYVVNIDVAEESIKPIWRPHFVVVVLLFVSAAIIPVYTSGLMQQKSFSDLLKTQRILSAHPLVNHVAVSYGKTITNTTKAGVAETTYVSARILLKNNQIVDTEFAREIAESIVSNYSEALEKDFVLVNFIYGYDIGIASKWKSYSHKFNPGKILKRN